MSVEGRVVEGVRWVDGPLRSNFAAACDEGIGLESIYEDRG